MGQAAKQYESPQWTVPDTNLSAVLTQDFEQRGTIYNADFCYSRSMTRVELARDSYRQSMKRINRSKKLMAKAYENLVASDLRRLAQGMIGQLPQAADELMKLYQVLEERYEHQLLRLSHVGSERRVTMGKLSIVCRHLGKLAESAQLAQQSFCDTPAALGSDGFWSLFGY